MSSVNYYTKKYYGMSPGAMRRQVQSDRKQSAEDLEEAKNCSKIVKKGDVLRGVISMVSQNVDRNDCIDAMTLQKLFKEYKLGSKIKKLGYQKISDYLKEYPDKFSVEKNLVGDVKVRFLRENATVGCLSRSKRQTFVNHNLADQLDAVKALMKSTVDQRGGTPAAVTEEVIDERRLLQTVKDLIAENADEDGYVEGPTLGGMFRDRGIDQKIKKLGRKKLSGYLMRYPEEFEIERITLRNQGTNFKVRVKNVESRKIGSGILKLATNESELNLGSYVLARITELSSEGCFVQFFSKSGLLRKVRYREDFYKYRVGRWVLLRIVSKTPDGKYGLSEDGVSNFHARQLLEEISANPLRIYVVGATGAGKSSLINAIFSFGSESTVELAEVGKEYDPKTRFFFEYAYNRMMFIDMPGVGDSVENDKKWLARLNARLEQEEGITWYGEKGKGGGTIAGAMLLLVLNAVTRDYGETFDLIKKTEVFLKLPVICALNQVDKTLLRPAWDDDQNAPSEKLRVAIGDKVRSVSERLRTTTGVCPEVIPVVAGFSDELGSMSPYNISHLLQAIKRICDLPKMF